MVHVCAENLDSRLRGFGWLVTQGRCRAAVPVRYCVLGIQSALSGVPPVGQLVLRMRDMIGIQML